MNIYSTIIENKPKELAKILKQGNVDINETNPDGETPLMLAVRYNHKRCFMLLIVDKRIEINKRNNQLKTAAHLAFEQGDLKVIARLFSTKKVDSSLEDETGISVKHHALFKIMKFLIPSYDSEVISAELFAFDNYLFCKKIINPLIKNEVDVNYYVNEVRESLLFYLKYIEIPDVYHYIFIIAMYLQDAKVVKEVFKKPDYIDINSIRIDSLIEYNEEALFDGGVPAIHYAVTVENPQLVAELLQHPDIDLSLVDDFGYSVADIIQRKLKLARSNKLNKIIDLLSPKVCFRDHTLPIVSDISDIPNIIHFIWVGDKIPEDYLRNIVSVILGFPSHRVILWTDNPMLFDHPNIPVFGTDMDCKRTSDSKSLDLLALFEQWNRQDMSGGKRFCIKHIDTLKEFFNDQAIADVLMTNNNIRISALVDMLRQLWGNIDRFGIGNINHALRADILRVLILYLHGGIYFDTDTYFCLISNDELFNLLKINTYAMPTGEDLSLERQLLSPQHGFATYAQAPVTIEDLEFSEKKENRQPHKLINNIIVSAKGHAILMSALTLMYKRLSWAQQHKVLPIFDVKLAPGYMEAFEERDQKMGLTRRNYHKFFTEGLTYDDIGRSQYLSAEIPSQEDNKTILFNRYYYVNNVTGPLLLWQAMEMYIAYSCSMIKLSDLCVTSYAPMEDYGLIPLGQDFVKFDNESYLLGNKVVMTYFANSWIAKKATYPSVYDDEIIVTKFHTSTVNAPLFPWLDDAQSATADQEQEVKPEEEVASQLITR